jgi:hypothetical protein
VFGAVLNSGRDCDGVSTAQHPFEPFHAPPMEILKRFRSLEVHLISQRSLPNDSM